MGRKDKTNSVIHNGAESDKGDWRSGSGVDDQSTETTTEKSRGWLDYS